MTELKAIDVVIDKTDVCFDDVSFVLRAVSKDKHRPHLCCVLVEDGKIVGTDGSRLHQATVPDTITAGCYEVIQHTKKTIVLRPISGVTYPPYKLVLVGAELVHLESHVTENHPLDASILIAVLIRGLDKVKTDSVCRFSIDYKHVRDLTSCGGQTWHIEYYKQHDAPLISLSTSTRNAVIAPAKG